MHGAASVNWAKAGLAALRHRMAGILHLVTVAG